MRVALAEDLVDVAALVRVGRFGMLGIDDLDEVLAVVETRDHALRAALGERARLVGERIVVHGARHRFAGAQRGEVERARPRDLAVPGCVERVVLLAVEDAALFRVACDQGLQRALDARPDALQELVVGRHMMLAQRAQDRAGLPVDRHAPVVLGAIVDDARVVVEREPEVDHLARRSLERGERARESLRVLPHVRARPAAAVRALVGVEAAVVEAIAGRARGDRGVQERALEEPPGQRRVVPGRVPETRGLGQPIDVIEDVFDDVVVPRRVPTPRRIHSDEALERLLWQVRKPPSDDECEVD